MRPPTFAARAAVLLAALALARCAPAEEEAPAAMLRIATFNVEDVRTDDLMNPDHPRLRRIAATVQRIRPDILLVNEIAYDQPGAPGYVDGTPEGHNAQRLAESFLGVSQGEGLDPIHYDVFMAPTNTGVASGFDFDRDGQAVSNVPVVPSATPEGDPGRQTDEGRAYGNDAWGFGMFPGQYGLALLVRSDLEILRDSVRTFREFPWSRMPGARMPTVTTPDSAAWYAGPAGDAFRLSSKSHWDVPVRLDDGRVLHVLCSHPTPPAFDGPEGRNKRRNHDEIRLWGDYLGGAEYIVDDAGRSGGLPAGASFVLLGDLNADPDEGSALNDPVGTFLLASPRVNGDVVPLADSTGRAAFPDLDPDDTARWGQRADYVLPSADLNVVDAGIVRPGTREGASSSDHFPVWIDVRF